MSKGISRDNDTAGGDLIPSQTSVYADGELVIVDGDDVAPHGPGIHAAAVTTATTTSVYVEGILVTREDDPATCGDLATGSSTVFVGD